MKKNVNVASLMGSGGGMGPSRNRPALLVFAVIFLVGTIAAALYLSFQKTAISEREKSLDTEIAQLMSQIQSLKTQKIEAAQSARSWLQDIEKDEIRWSGVLRGLNELVPVDATSGKPKIRFLSYSGSAGGKLTLNAETLPSAKPLFEDISQLINIFNSSTFFKEAYVPSISRGLSETGDVILSFLFNVTYAPQSSADSDLSTLPATTEVTPAEDSGVKVPRKTQ